MQKFTQKYTIIQLLEPKDEGDEWKSNKWPLHVTIADTFAVDWDKNNLKQKFTNLIQKQPIATATGDHFEYFGPEKEVKVTILDMSEELVSLHNNVVRLLKDAGAVFNDPQYTEEGFRAHATVQSHASVKKGESLIFNALAIIDMFPGEDPYRRKILSTVKLNQS
jgi:2'-5' RNA ligase